MKIVSNINGNQKTTSYGNKVFYRESVSSNYKQVKRVFYRESSNSSYKQVYLYDEVAPTISITSSSSDTVNSSYTFTANVIDTESGLASISINNVSYPITYGSTSVNVSKAFTLGYGSNTFTIKAIDVAGNSSQASLTVNYVNDKNNSSNNWTLTRHRKEDYSSTNHRQFDDVYVNGTWYTYFTVQENSGDSWVRTFLTVSETIIPMPKGLKTAQFSMKAYGAGGNSNGRPAYGDWSIQVIDQTTNQVLASYSDEWQHESGGSNYGTSAKTFVISLSETQSTHNLVVKFEGSGYGWEYSDCKSGVGLSQSNTGGDNGFIFTYY